MVSIDTVYQKVLALANKEQRGYITPQEFNLFADHAQKDIFKQYFFELERRKRGIGKKGGYDDLITNLEEKIGLFERKAENTTSTGNDGKFSVSDDIENTIYKITEVLVKHTHVFDYTGTVSIPSSERQFIKSDLVQITDFNRNKYLLKNNMGALGLSYHCFYSQESGNPNVNSMIMEMFPIPSSGSTVTISYIKQPDKPNWTYLLSGEAALFNEDANAGWRDFELHEEEENALVIKILQLAGVNLKDYNLVQIAGQESAKNFNQENQ